VITDFKTATKRAVQAGYKVMEIHAAHGIYYISFYLLYRMCELMCTEGVLNRIRLTEVVEAVQQEEWPSNLPLFVRISATDWADGGWNAENQCSFLKY
jgi:2,4-dienoyl-CoA reductase-like NADH-dependent reductase (Old Yellow Enzyme family)